MAKPKIASPEIQKLVQDIATENGLAQFVKFQALTVEKSKEVVKVKKANGETEALTDKEVIVLVYEKAFDKVDEATQILWLRSEMSKVYYDSEKEKVIVGGEPIISIPLGFLEKHGENAINKAKLAIHVISQIEDEERERKALEKVLKKGKKKKY